MRVLDINMTIRVDPTARGYKYMSRTEQHAMRDIEWVGIVEANGEIGALGRDKAGQYCLYSSGRRPIELDPIEVAAALANPQPVNPRGRKTGARGPHRPHSVTMDGHTRSHATELGDGNLSLGVRRAVEYVKTQVHPEQFRLWVARHAADL